LTSIVRVQRCNELKKQHVVSTMQRSIRRYVVRMYDLLLPVALPTPVQQRTKQLASLCNQSND
jgi:hypothetical protein